jgi:hypothetical protein
MKTISISQWVAAAVNHVAASRQSAAIFCPRRNPFRVENLFACLPRVAARRANPGLSAAIPLGLKERGIYAASMFQLLRVQKILTLRNVFTLMRPEGRAPLAFATILFFALLFTTSTHAQITNLNLGNLAPGESVTVTYEVTINNTLPPTLQGITNQAVVSATNAAPANSDDPKTGALLDPTVTPLVVTPFAATVAATGVSAQSATLNGLVFPGGDVAGYYFEYWTNVANELRTMTNILAASFATSAVNATVSGLLPNTVYQFRVLATNSLGLVGGSYLSLTTTVFSITQQPVNSGACVGSTAQFSVGVNAPGTGTYQWQRRNPGAAPGAFNNIGGATSSIYNTPIMTAADDDAAYRVIVSAPGTNITSSEALLSVIAIGSPTVTYDFNSGLPPNTAVYGSSFVSSGLLELNPNVMSQSGAFLMPDLAPGRLVRGFVANFKVRMIRGGAENGDGFSFNWATDLPNSIYATGEEGEGSGLRVCFDTYNNGLSEAPAIDVKWGTNVLGHYLTSNAFLPGIANDFADVSIRLNTDGTLDVTYRCVPIFTRLIVTNYAPLISARFGLGSRAGAAFESHSIDDLALQLFVDPTNGVPRITSVKTNGSGGLSIIGTGTPGATLALNAATNPAGATNWTFRATVVPNGSGVFSFNEPNISSPPYRFYKLGSVPQLPPNLVTWWRAESNYLDSFGGNHGASTNLGFTAGQRGQAFNFNGTNSAMNIGGSAIPIPWTAAFWVKRQDAVGTSAALLTDVSTGLKLEQAGGLRRVGFTQFGVLNYSFNYVVPTNTWTHLTFVGRAGGTVLYTNGVAADTNAATINLPLGVMGALGGGTGDPLKAVVDEATIFNRALTPAEIQQVINATRGP